MRFPVLAMPFLIMNSVSGEHESDASLRSVGCPMHVIRFQREGLGASPTREHLS